MWEKCSWNRNLVHLARNMAIFSVLACEMHSGAKQTHFGPNGQCFGGKQVRARPKAGPDITQMYFVHQQGQWDLARRATEAQGPVFGMLGRFGAFGQN